MDGWMVGWVDGWVEGRDVGVTAGWISIRTNECVP